MVSTSVQILHLNKFDDGVAHDLDLKIIDNKAYIYCKVTHTHIHFFQFHRNSLDEISE